MVNEGRREWIEGFDVVVYRTIDEIAGDVLRKLHF